ILEELVEDFDEADSAYRWSLELDESNTAARWSRQDLARRRESWAALATLLYEEIEATEDVERQLELLLDLGDVYKDHLDSPDEAAQCFMNVWEFDETNPRAVSALQELGYDIEGEAESTAQADEPQGVV